MASIESSERGFPRHCVKGDRGRINLFLLRWSFSFLCFSANVNRSVVRWSETNNGRTFCYFIICSFSNQSQTKLGRKNIAEEKSFLSLFLLAVHARRRIRPPVRGTATAYAKPNGTERLFNHHHSISPHSHLYSNKNRFEYIKLSNDAWRCLIYWKHFIRMKSSDSAQSVGWKMIFLFRFFFFCRRRRRSHLITHIFCLLYTHATMAVAAAEPHCLPDTLLCPRISFMNGSRRAHIICLFSFHLCKQNF